MDEGIQYIYMYLIDQLVLSLINGAHKEDVKKQTNCLWLAYYALCLPASLALTISAH